MRRLIFCLCFFSAIATAEPLQVATSVLPIKTLVKQIGGERVKVQSLIARGDDPHHYEPTSRQVAALRQASLYVHIGLPFESAWLPRLRSTNPALSVLEAYPEKPFHEHAHQHVDHHHAFDPHVWTSPLVVKQMARRVRDALIVLDPQHKAVYTDNYAVLEKQLDALHSEIKQLLMPLRQRRFLVFHPAWGHFAAAYDLIQVAVEQEGKEPGIRTLAALIQQAKAEQVRVIFAQPQLSQRFVRQFAQAIDGKVVLVDPLEADYIHNLRQVAIQFAQAL